MKLDKIIAYGLYFIAFFLPVQTRWIIKPAASEYLTISLYGTDIILVLVLLLFVVYKIKNSFQFLNRKQIPNPKSQIPNKFKIQNSNFLFFSIAGLILTAFISIFFAQDKLIAVYHFIVFLAGIGLFWLIVSANYNKLKLILSFLAGIFLQAGLGIWQFLTQSSFANKWLGMAAHSAGDLGVSVVETLQGGRWLRAYGGLDHPNILGGLIVIGILLILEILIYNFQFSIFNFQTIFNFQFLKKYKKEANLKQNSLSIQSIQSKILNKSLLLTSYFLLLTALFFTFSRGAWAGLIIGILIILAAMVIKRDLRGQKALLKIILISTVLIFILFNLFQDLVLTRLSQDTRLEVKSNVERVMSYKESWSMIKNNWLGGAGMGNYTIEIGGGMPAWHYQPAHNVFLLVWAEVGIFGLLFFVSLLFHVSCFMFYVKGETKHNNSIINLSITAALFAMFFVDHWWWSLHFGVLLFWLVLGLIFAIDWNENKAYNNSIIHFNK
jgi:O-antigen ligase